MIRGRKERRRHHYAFSTLGSLYEHYDSRLPREEIVLTVRAAISAFMPRDGSTHDETRMQLVRKCELALRARTAELETRAASLQGEGAPAGAWEAVP